MLALELAHRRFIQQAGWTATLRRHIFQRAGLPNARRVVEIGCGTGAVLRTVVLPPHAGLHGVDIDLALLRVAGQEVTTAKLVAADAHRLPYSDGAFDIAFFHFVLLWLADPVNALAETARVTRPGGAVIAFAEPDYYQRVDQPGRLAELGKLQTEALRTQGADPDLGGRLPELLQSAGLKVVESGQLRRPAEPPKAEDAALEWEVMRADLQGLMDAQGLDNLEQVDQQARLAGERIAFVPTYYAWGRVA